MGGSVFYQTPLGRATARVMDDAVRKITEAIASRRWQPKIAALNDDGTVLLNGGMNRKVAVGRQYDVLEIGQAIVDPDTGDLLGRKEDTILGRLRVVEVRARYSVAEVVSGDPERLRVGLSCRLFLTPPQPETPRQGSAASPVPSP